MATLGQLESGRSQDGRMENVSESRKENWRNQRWVPVLAILVSVVPMYAALIIYHLSALQETYSMGGFFGYLTINGSISLTVIYLLQRFLLSKRFGELNLKAGKWWQDALGVIILVILTLGVLPYVTSFVTASLPREDMSGLGELFSGLAENPLLAMLFIGPVLAIGVGFEEVTRVFFLKRAWEAWQSSVAQWVSIILSAAVFGLAHLYQGVGGVVSTGIYGLLMAIYYRYIGRMMPMVIAHYLHDAIQFVMLIILIRNGVIQI